MQEIHSDEAPQSVGFYSQGVKIGSLLFVSGQVPIDPQTNQLIEGSIQEKADRVIDNLEAILKSGGSSLKHVVRVEVFLADLKRDFQSVNEVYAKRFNGKIKPARQTVEVSALPLGADIEISCIAVLEEE